MLRTKSHHTPFFISTVDKIKAVLLSLLIITASAPNLQAQSQCLDPYETNCVVGNCSTSGCTYTLTVKDDTPGAFINYVVYAVGGSQIASGQVYSGGSFTVSSSAYCPVGSGSCYPSQGLYGYMHAAESGYLPSNQVSLSF